MVEIVLIIDDDASFKMECVQKLASQVRVITCSINNVKNLKTNSPNYILIGGEDSSDNKKLVKFMKTKLTCTMIALSDDESDLSANELVKAGCIYKSNRKEVIRFLLDLIIAERNLAKIVSELEGQENDIRNFKAAVLEFTTLYQEEKISTIESAEKHLNIIEPLADKLKDLKIKDQVRRVKRILWELKFSDDEAVNLYAENFKRELLNLHFLAISKEKN